MAETEIVIPKAIKRELGYIYFIDKEGNLCKKKISGIEKKRRAEEVESGKLLPDDIVSLVKEVSDDKSSYDKLKDIENKEDLNEAAKYIIINSFDKQYEALKERIRELRRKGKDVFIVDIRMMIIQQRIKLIKVLYSIEDRKNIKKIKEMFDIIERETKEIQQT